MFLSYVDVSGREAIFDLAGISRVVSPNPCLLRGTIIQGNMLKIAPKTYLRSQVFLDCYGEVCPTLDCCIVGNNHAFDPLYSSDARHHSARRYALFGVKLVASERSKFEERRTRIHERLYPLPGKKFPTFLVPRCSSLSAASFNYS